MTTKATAKNSPAELEILSVGTELLTGSIIDTNAAYIAEQSEVVGLNVIRHSSVGDDLNRLTNILLEIATRAEIAIVTGGLGPTPDDLSREAAADAANVPLELNCEALEAIQEMFERLKRHMPEANRKQAYFPANAEYLPNPIGTAPGFAMTINETKFYFLPGVPVEMKKMLHEQVLPRIISEVNGRLDSLVVETLTTFGVAEAVIGEQLAKLERKFPQLQFGTRADFPIVDVKIIARKQTPEIDNQILAAKQELLMSLGDWVISDNQTSLSKTINELLSSAGKTLSIIECPSGGLLAHELTGNESHGLILLSSVMNLNKLREFLQQSQNCEMSCLDLIRTAKQNRQLEASFTLLITGASNERESQLLQIPVGTVYIAIVGESTFEVYTCQLPFGNMEYRREYFAALALDLLRRKLQNLNYPKQFFGKPLIDCLI